jgi:hypothetical protein
MMDIEVKCMNVEMGGSALWTGVFCIPILKCLDWDSNQLINIKLGSCRVVLINLMLAYEAFLSRNSR